MRPCKLSFSLLDKEGYSRVRVAGKLRGAHIVAWEEAHGEPVPDGLVVHHRCETKNCIEPTHLQAVTRAEHIDVDPGFIAHQQRLRTHCPKGHPYDEENTLWWKNHRRCKACNKERKAA